MIGFCFLQEVVSRQYMDYIRDLEEDRFSLRSRVAELEAENTKLGQEVEEVWRPSLSGSVNSGRVWMSPTTSTRGCCVKTLRRRWRSSDRECTRGLVSSHPRKGERWDIFRLTRRDKSWELEHRTEGEKSRRKRMMRTKTSMQTSGRPQERGCLGRTN